MILVGLLAFVFALRAVYFLTGQKDPIEAITPIIKRLKRADDNDAQGKKLENLG